MNKKGFIDYLLVLTIVIPVLAGSLGYRDALDRDKYVEAGFLQEDSVENPAPPIN